MAELGEDQQLEKAEAHATTTDVVLSLLAEVSSPQSFVLSPLPPPPYRKEDPS